MNTFNQKVPGTFCLRKRYLVPFGLVFLLLVVPRAFAWTQEERSQFEKASRHYQQGQFQEAATLYESLSKKHPEAAVFFYNLGNSYFKIKRLGPAILAYERAFALEPGNADIRRNLNYTRSLLEYRMEDKRNWYVRAAERFLKGFTFEEITFLWTLFYFLLAASWAVALLLQRGAPWGWRRKTLALLLLLFSALALGKQVQRKMFPDAVVLDKDTEVRYGPSDSDQLAFRLGEGYKVYVVDRRSDWSRIYVPSGETGWVKNRQIAEISVS